jgi:antitoxin ParD1/3/4
MRSIHVKLPDDLYQFLESEASAKGFHDAADYAPEILVAFWKEKARDELETRIVESLESGPAIEATPQFWADLRARVHARVRSAI